VRLARLDLAIVVLVVGKVHCRTGNRSGAVRDHDQARPAALRWRRRDRGGRRIGFDRFELGSQRLRLLAQLLGEQVDRIALDVAVVVDIGRRTDRPGSGRAAAASTGARAAPSRPRPRRGP
jgi:hypothetical protein